MKLIVHGELKINLEENIAKYITCNQSQYHTNNQVLKEKMYELP